jgi:hypothetical protein
MKSTKTNGYCFFSRDFVGSCYLPESEDREIIASFSGNGLLRKILSVLLLRSIRAGKEGILLLTFWVGVD